LKETHFLETAVPVFVVADVAVVAMAETLGVTDLTPKAAAAQ
jgi:hypothetical protein